MMSEENDKTGEGVEQPFIDPWQPQQRELINKLVEHEYTTLCEKKSTYPTINIPADKMLEFMEKLRSEHAFDMLKSHTCVDWIDEGIFELITLFFSTTHLQHIWISTTIPRDNPVIHSLSSIWPIAEFQEREVYDLFGVQYAGNSDLRRLFLDDDWQGFPLRKDYQDDFMLERPQ